MVDKLTALDDKSNSFAIIELLFLAKLAYVQLVCSASSTLCNL